MSNDENRRKKFNSPPEKNDRIKLYRGSQLVRDYSDDGIITYTGKDALGIFIDNPTGIPRYVSNTFNDLRWEKLPGHSGEQSESRIVL